MTTRGRKKKNYGICQKTCILKQTRYLTDLKKPIRNRLLFSRLHVLFECRFKTKQKQFRIQVIIRDFRCKKTKTLYRADYSIQFFINFHQYYIVQRI